MCALLQRGSIGAAYKSFRDQAVFPGIVCRICGAPCMAACCRAEKDAAVDIPLLEKALCGLAPDTAPPRYNLPPKSGRIAIVGAGLSGLACALRLGRKSYDVTVYEAGDCCGGRAGGLMDGGGGREDGLMDDGGEGREGALLDGGGDRAAGLMDRSEVLAEIERQMDGARLRLRYGCRVTSLEELGFDAAEGLGFDAIYIATGAGGEDFGLLSGVDPVSLATVVPGVFLGGALCGAEPVYDIAHGVLAAHSIEKFLKTGLMDGVPESIPKTKSGIVMDLSGVPALPAVRPAGGSGYTKEEAVLEAQRCVKCDCTLCRDACELFDYFRKEPRQIIGDAIASQHTGDFAVTRQTTTQLIASCNLCGLCGKVCPKGIDIGMMAYDFRHFKRLSGKYPPAYADFYLKDMRFSNTEAAYAAKPGAPGPGSWMFFPGCQLGAETPLYITEAYGYLLGKNAGAGIMLACCGAPADWGGEAEENAAALEAIRGEWERQGRPLMICACPTCMKQFARFLPEMEVVSLYEILCEYGLPENAGASAGMVMPAGAEAGVPAVAQASGAPGRAVSVFDPCAGRDFPKARESVRAILETLGLRTEELPYSGEEAQCCGAGAQAASANPKLAGLMTKNRISENELPYICYCANCRDTFRLYGKEAVHVLDLVFGCGAAGGAMPTLDERRANRLEAKRLVMERFFGEGPQDGAGREASVLGIPPALLLKMRKLLIREQEILDTIAYCESTGNKLHDAGKGTFIGHLRQGLATFWAEYRKDGDGFVLENAYAHRIEILGEQSHSVQQDGGTVMREAGKSGEGAPGKGMPVCVRCGLALEAGQTKFSYLGHEMVSETPLCPKCGQVYLEEGLVNGRIRAIEGSLEDK